MTAALAWLLTCSLVIGALSCAERPEARHLILISIDTLRADYLPSYGHPFVETPHIDRLAAEGFLFENHISAAPTTLASHVALMTGTWPHTHGVPRNGFVVDSANLMLAEVLQRNGFETAGFIGAFPLSDQFSFDQGFTHWDEQLTLAKAGSQGRLDQNQRPANEVTDAAIAWLDEAPDDKPLFLFVHYFDVHAPYDPPPEFARLYREDEDPRNGSLPMIRRARIELLERRPSELQDHLKRSYAAGITWVDHEIGRLIEHLEAQGILDEAIVVLTSDHGEAMGESWERWDHGLSVGQATTRTPLIIRMPKGFEGGRRLDALVSNIDVMPSLLDLFNMEIPAAVEGESFAKALRASGWTPARRHAFSEATRPKDRQVEMNTRWANERKCRAVQDERWKLIQCPLLRLVWLHELTKDPQERINVASDHLERVQALQTELDTWTRDAQVRAQRRDPDPETRTRLEALGYIEEEEPGQ
jgi:arylsulfatase